MASQPLQHDRQECLPMLLIRLENLNRGVRKYATQVSLRGNPAHGVRQGGAPTTSLGPVKRFKHITGEHRAVEPGIVDRGPRA